MADDVFQLLVRSYRSTPTFSSHAGLDTPNRANKFAIRPVTSIMTPPGTPARQARGPLCPGTHPLGPRRGSPTPDGFEVNMAQVYVLARADRRRKCSFSG